jgi:hypothetical protein
MDNSTLPQFPSVEIGTSSPQTEMDAKADPKVYMYPFKDTETFNASIFRKKEFYENRLDRTVEPIKPRTLLRHQKIISTFFSAKTLYDRLLVVHLMGTGKTCVSIAAVEKLLNDPSSTIKTAYILTKNELLVDQFERSILNICTPEGKYADKKSVRYRYKVMTYNTFTSKVIKTREDKLNETFSNCVFVVDEIHTIALNAKSEDRIYDYLHKVFHTCENIKVMLMSGTPMRDDVSEIAYIMNLLLPMSKQIDPGTFESEYFDSETGEVRKELMDTQFRSLIEGKVSYLLPPETKNYRYMMNVVECPKTKLEEMEVFYDTYCSTLLPKQYGAYIAAYNQDTMRYGEVGAAKERVRGFYSNSQQAMLCVDPSGKYGRDLNKRLVGEYINKGGKTDAEMATMRMSDDEKFAFKLSNLRELSCKYATTIELIRRARAERKSVWLFCNLVQGSGIDVLVAILKLFGLRPLSLSSESSTSSSTDYFANTSDPTLTDTDRLKMIRMFNSRENMHGEVARVIIGSPKLAEGVSLRNVQQIQILTPHWNFTLIEQAIYRCLRYDSYRDFENAGEEYMCDIYLHMGSYDTRAGSNDTNIDVVRYRTSYEKDIKIKQIEYVLKTSAFDCALNYKRNVRVFSEDNSRECLYSKCADYTCHGFSGPDEYLTAPTPFEMSTYLESQDQQVYYKTSELVPLIKNMFVRKFRISFEEIRFDVNARKESETEYTDLEIVDVLRHMIYSRTPMVDRNRFACFLNERDDVYFLTAEMTTDATCNDGFYSEFPVVSTRVDFSNVLKQMYIDQFVSQPDLYAMNDTELNTWFENAPTNVITYFSEKPDDGLEAEMSDAERAFLSRVKNKFSKSKSSDISTKDYYSSALAPRIKQKYLNGQFVEYTTDEGDTKKVYYPTIVMTKDGKTFSLIVDSETNSKILNDTLTNQRKIPSGIDLAKKKVIELDAISRALGIVSDGKLKKEEILAGIKEAATTLFGEMPGEDEYIVVPASKIT